LGSEPTEQQKDIVGLSTEELFRAQPWPRLIERSKTPRGERICISTSPKPKTQNVQDHAVAKFKFLEPGPWPTKRSTEETACDGQPSRWRVSQAAVSRPVRFIILRFHVLRHTTKPQIFPTQASNQDRTRMFGQTKRHWQTILVPRSTVRATRRLTRGKKAAETPGWNTAPNLLALPFGLSATLTGLTYEYVRPSGHLQGDFVIPPPSLQLSYLYSH
jgi:hypothetical protein